MDEMFERIGHFLKLGDLVLELGDMVGGNAFDVGAGPGLVLPQAEKR